MTPLAGFLDQLFHSGRIVLPSSAPLRVAESAAIDLLKQEEQALRRDFPGDAPAFSLETAYWAAGLLYRACQFFAARDLPEQVLRQELSADCPAPADSPESIWSADVTFRYLPDLYRLAAGMASADPLVDALSALADCWPLSGAGVPAGDSRGNAMAPILAHLGLQRLYVDRVIACGDRDLLHSDILANQVKAAFGDHFENPFPDLQARVTDSARPDTEL